MSQNDQELVELYLTGQLSAEEKESFLLRLEAEPELREQVKLEQDMMAALDDTDWAFIENADHEEVKAYAEAFASEKAKALKESIQKADQAYHSKDQKKKNPKIRPLWIYSVAAAAVITIAIVMLRPTPLTPDVLYSAYLQKTELPDLTTRSADDNAAELLRAQALFNNGEYEAAVGAFEKLLAQNPNESALYINLAISQAELGRFETAIANLDLLINSNLLDAQKGYWYKSLVYLKAAQPEKSKQVLQTIADRQYYNHKLASQLLKDL